MKTNNKLIGVVFLTAIAALLCCITPILALIAGKGSLASTFYRLEFLRQFLIGLTIFVLVFV